MRALGGFILLVAAWALLSATGWINPAFLASPAEVWHAFWRMAAGGLLGADLRATALRVVEGAGLACALGVPLGLLLGGLPGAYAWLEGSFDFLRSVPPIVAYPLCILILGTSDASRVAVVVFGCVTVMVVHAAAAVAHIPPVRLASVRQMGAGRLQVLRLVVLPEALPHLFLGMRTVVSLAIIIVVVTEMLVGAAHGLGSRLVEAQMAYRTGEVYAEIILVGALGFGVNHVLAWLERRLIHWRA